MTETLLPIRIPFCRCFGLPRPGPTQRGCTATRRHLRVAAASRYQRRKVTLPRGLSRSRRDGPRHVGMQRRPSSRRLARYGRNAASTGRFAAGPPAPFEPFRQQASNGFGGVAVARPPMPQDRPHDGARLPTRQQPRDQAHNHARTHQEEPRAARCSCSSAHSYASLSRFTRIPE
jgi:hypothetical protein